MLDLQTASPVEIDTQIAALYDNLNKVVSMRIVQSSDVYHAAGARRTYGRGQSGWTLGFAEALATAKTKAADESMMAHQRQFAVNAVKGYEALQAQAQEIREEIASYNVEFTRRGGWTRAHLVTDGHVHSSMDCSTCNNGEYPTVFYWLTQFSGKTEAEVVEAAADRACTVCYPSAPVETAGPSALMTPDERTRSEQREAAAVAKAERLAKKIEKGLTEDGSEFVVSHPGFQPNTVKKEYFKTEQAAVQWMVRYMVWGQNGSEDYTPAFKAIIEAVATKHGKTFEQVLAEVSKKVAVKAKKDGMPSQRYDMALLSA